MPGIPTTDCGNDGKGKIKLLRVIDMHRNLPQAVIPECSCRGSIDLTNKYDVHRLVYFEQHEDMNSAITREKRIKKWNRAWKIRLIEGQNPDWKDLYNELF